MVKKKERGTCRCRTMQFVGIRMTRKDGSGFATVFPFAALGASANMC